MSGWQLALALFGVLLAGFVLGITAVWLYARHVFRQKFGALASALAAQTTGLGAPTRAPTTGTNLPIDGPNSP